MVLTAATGCGGIDLVCGTCPGVVILDLGLPDLDGLEVLRRIRPLTTSPILILSGRPASTWQPAALHLGADDYLIKPLRPKELVAKTSALILLRPDRLVLRTGWHPSIGRRCLQPASRHLRLHPASHDRANEERSLLGDL